MGFRVKQYFEHFLVSFSQFSYFIVSGAIAPNELCADFQYPIALMTGDAKDMKWDNSGLDIQDFVDAVCDYLTRWEEKTIKEFMRKIQRVCNPSAPDYDCPDHR